ncbi:hypothetical protein [Paraburkholderia humisilvae]|uniref:Uncharacterized protein n=1 Tax=Paraburkholderia humisilvae TaxID=627669 RepID=A0A6J5DJ45_9BURK|nr:hypothetical protein [Paraburkholderia humisilvae]CAB3754189.1 hypothetical protein LMG29542_02274 [Paraburkholderia humisilvae]
MTQKLYRVVETVWKKEGRVAIDIGSTWKPEKAAREEMQRLTAKAATKLYSLERQGIASRKERS